MAELRSVSSERIVIDPEHREDAQPATHPRIEAMIATIISGHLETWEPQNAHEDARVVLTCGSLRELLRQRATVSSRLMLDHDDVFCFRKRGNRARFLIPAKKIAGA